MYNAYKYQPLRHGHNYALTAFTEKESGLISPYAHSECVSFLCPYVTNCVKKAWEVALLSVTTFLDIHF